jgi:uncharacterized membrane protein YhaH (DUF805 family)
MEETTPQNRRQFWIGMIISLICLAAVLIGNVPPVTISRGISTMVVERVLDMLFIVVLLPLTLANVETLPDWMRLGARVSGIMAVTAIVILIVAANQRPLANRIGRFFLDRIPFMNTATWLARLDSLLAGLDSLTRLKDGRNDPF